MPVRKTVRRDSKTSATPCIRIWYCHFQIKTKEMTIEDLQLITWKWPYPCICKMSVFILCFKYKYSNLDKVGVIYLLNPCIYFTGVWTWKPINIININQYINLKIVFNHFVVEKLLSHLVLRCVNIIEANQNKHMKEIAPNLKIYIDIKLGAW